MHPGPITNYADCLEKDEQRYNLFGTDTIKGLEKEYIDTYIDTNFKQNYDFYIINEELWQFLVKRYGGDVIKKLYVRKNYYTQVE